MDESDRKQARELLLKTKVYKLLATVFAAGGALVFLILHYQYFGGDFVASLKDPMTIVLVLFPFVPSLILSFRARKAEQALQKLLKPHE